MFTNRPTRNQLLAVICLLLALVTLVVYWPITRHGFTNFDDDGYITGNPHVKSGLTWPGIVWSFKTTETANWHPLTWISHMLDCQLYGLNPGGHHLTNLMFHIANTLLLFLLLTQLTGAVWRSAFVAALFAWHPLHVESVAWAAERKDVLSAFFWMLTLFSYTRTRMNQSPATPKSQPSTLCLALFFFACGLMSKPMVVTLPFRFVAAGLVAVEPFSAGKLRTFCGQFNCRKTPFLRAGSSRKHCDLFCLRRAGGAVSNDTFAFRLTNALWSYLRYIFKTFWPVDLAVIYPFPGHGLRFRQ